MHICNTWRIVFIFRFFFLAEKVNFQNSDNLYEFHINSSGQFLIFAKTKDEHTHTQNSTRDFHFNGYIFHGPSVTEEIQQEPNNVQTEPTSRKQIIRLSYIVIKNRSWFVVTWAHLWQ